VPAASAYARKLRNGTSTALELAITRRCPLSSLSPRVFRFPSRLSVARSRVSLSLSLPERVPACALTHTDAPTSPRRVLRVSRIISSRLVSSRLAALFSSGGPDLGWISAPFGYVISAYLYRDAAVSTGCRARLARSLRLAALRGGAASTRATETRCFPTRETRTCWNPTTINTEARRQEARVVVLCTCSRSGTLVLVPRVSSGECPFGGIDGRDMAGGNVRGGGRKMERSFV